MAASLTEQLDIEAQLIAGSGGIFEVSVDGKVVSAKTREGFPADQAVVDAVARALGR